MHKNYKANGVNAPHGVTLDGPFLLRLHRVDKPFELCSVDISEQNLSAVKGEDFKEFANVAFIDASVNSLSLGSFSCFLSLRKLDLSLNGICNISFDVTDFPQLEVLDLSYNSLSADDLASLGKLSRLKVLHLTGNHLHRLPLNLGSSNTDTTQLPGADEGEDCHFRALEVLMLDDNRLSSGVFSSLTNLKRLKHLNLQGNRISEIPYAQIIRSIKTMQISPEMQAEEAQTSNVDEHLNRILQIFHTENWEECYQEPNLPLPELQFLNLANNKIAKEEALLAAALFPNLCEVDIHSNPLVTLRKGEPPLLGYLQERLGITIKRKRTHKVLKLPPNLFTDPKLKVDETIPKVSKKLISMNAQTQTEKNGAPVKRAKGLEDKNSKDHSIRENTECFFLTEIARVAECKFHIPSKEKEITENKKTSYINAERYKTLVGPKPNPDVLKTIGIQTAVRMLEHTLKNPSVYRDSKPKLDSIQTPYRNREKRIKELPPVKPVKRQKERVDEMIQEIKASTAIKVVTLGSAIDSKGDNKGEHKEALSLLRDMKKKYKMVHMKTMEEAASLQAGSSGRDFKMLS
ncbi:X-ray radiation resistance-associated protein 1 [Pholidichthys leucotaenia]